MCGVNSSTAKQDVLSLELSLCLELTKFETTRCRERRNDRVLLSRHDRGTMVVRYK